MDKKLDISCWDLQKTLKLMRKSNLPLLVWLQSPIIYKEDLRISKILKETFPRYDSLINSNYNYLHIARGNCSEYFKGEEVWLKNIFIFFGLFSIVDGLKSLISQY